MKRMTLFLALVAAFLMSVGYTVTQSEAKYVTDGLIGYWPLDNSTIEGKTVKDIFGKNNGTIIGNPKIVEGKVGQALEFDGISGRVDCGGDESLRPTGGLTVEAWVKVNSKKDLGWKQTVGGCEDGPRGYVLRGLGQDNVLQMSAGNGAIWHDQAGSYCVYKGFELVTWYHVAGTVTANNGKIKVYVNAVQCNVGNELGVAGNLAASTKPFTIGSLDLYQDRTFPGAIDELRVYNRALTQSEIENNMLNVSTTAVNVAGKLAAIWGELKLEQ
jgi:hypothetical protein